MPINLTKEEIVKQKRDLSEVNSVCSTSGVYFLISGNEITYIGQTKDLANRVRLHVYQKSKQFDGFVFLKCDLGDALMVECQLITKHQPKYNKNKNRGDIRSHVMARFTETERNAIHAASAKLNISVSAFMQKAVLQLIQELK